MPLPFTHVFLGNGSVYHLPSPFGYQVSTCRQQNQALLSDALFAKFHVTLASENNRDKIFWIVSPSQN